MFLLVADFELVPIAYFMTQRLGDSCVKQFDAGLICTYKYAIYGGIIAIILPSNIFRWVTYLPNTI
ncbi:hypothetical protein DSO57_1019358 [Entomophthora muscae]|uniref:Uncharacterized protein n=1 Tax=Entomophthora muscae TaxID=34485 RepID=A0ACC2U1U1_9FUNG|nr:hypothetical protein DSO57_1019358 [Entomophthora muscae]